MKNLSIAVILTMFFIAGCQTNPSSASARQCLSGLTTAKQELNYAKTQGFSGTVEYTKATTLITGFLICWLL